MQKNFLLVRQDEKYGLFSATGGEVLPPSADELMPVDSQFIAFQQNGKWGACAISGKILEAEYDTLFSLTKGFLAVQKDGKLGIVNQTGKAITAFEFSRIRLADTLNAYPAPIFLVSGSSRQLLDQNGQVLVTVEKVFPAPDKLIFFTSGKKWGAFDANAKQVIPNAYVRFSILPEGFIALRGLTGDWALFNQKTGKTITKEEFSYFKVAKPSRIIARQGLKFGLLDQNGQIKIPITYQNLHYAGEGVFMAQTDEKWQLFDQDGQSLNTTKFDIVYDFLEGRAITKIRQGEKVGLIDFKGKIVVKPEFDALELYSDKALLFKSEEVHVFKLDGAKASTPVVYDNLAEANFRLEDLRGRTLFRWTVKDRPRQYRWFQKNTTQKWMLINQNRRKVFPNEFDRVYTDPYTGLTRAKRLSEEGKVTHCAIVDSREGKLLLEIAANDIAVEDFRSANVARVV
ncbi:MAG: WG repeat-containing protein, partial [Bacteroidota bacterium]